ncbi:hypothetical protein Bca4012_038186 [Brassica carinata]
MSGAGSDSKIPSVGAESELTMLLLLTAEESMGWFSMKMSQEMGVNAMSTCYY